MILVQLDQGSGRRFLSGVFRHLAAGHPWRIRLLQKPEELTIDTVRDCVREGVDGFILTKPGEPGYVGAIAASGIPTVFSSVGGEALALRDNVSFLWNDSADIGRRGARHLLSCGDFASFAFVHECTDGLDWSTEQAAAFRQTLAATGRPFFESPARDDIGSEEDRRALTDFLVSLPKPAGVMACWDRRAVTVLDVCSAAKLEVPHQVAVLGSDNDEFYCAFSIPPLSSVMADHEGIGYQAAVELDDLMAGRRGGEPRQIRMSARKVVARESTAYIPPATALVRKALAFIGEHATEGIAPGDVVRHLGVSRRLAELRFAELEGRTIRSSIEDVRLDRVKHLLKTTSRPLILITEETGFKSAAHLSRLFKARTSLSPLAWRKSLRRFSSAP